MRFYLIQWPGVYLGGYAVVRASSEAEAIETLCAAPDSHAKPGDCKVNEFELQNGPQVMYCDNGDY